MKYIVLLFFLTPVFAFSQDSLQAHYKIYSVERQQLVTPEDIVNDMEHADVLFFGEEHNDSTCHGLEKLLFTKLSEKYPGRTALSMEMFETDCQNVLNEYLTGLIREKDFQVDARPWPNYADYRPMIEYAKTYQVPVVAANAPQRYVSMVNRTGMDSLERLSRTGKSFLPPLPIDTATGAYYEKFLQIMGGHAMPGMQMYQAQNLWDATMAWSVAKFSRKHRGYKIFQVNGSFHSDQKLGAVAQLKKYDKHLRVLNIATCADADFKNPDWNALKNKGDYILVTDPAIPKTY